MKRLIVVPNLYAAAPYAHAVRVDEILYTSAIAALDSNGTLLHPGELVPQVHKIYGNISRILEVAGGTWDDVVKINHFFSSPGPSPSEFEGLREALGDYLALGQQAGTDVCLGPAPEGARLQVEVIAHIGVDKRVLSFVPRNNGRCWAPGVRVGRHVYLSGRRAYGVGAAVNSPTLADETRGVYSEFDGLLKEAGVAWRDVVRVRQFVTDSGADFNLVRNGRRDYVPTGAFTSTSLCCMAGDPSGNVASPWTIAVDLEATTGVKISANTNALVETPATAHALKIGNLVHLQAWISTDDKDEIVFPGDIEGQARQVLNKMDLMLAAAGCGWSDVITSRVFCREREHLQAVRNIERHWAGSSVFARSDAVCRFFDPEALVEIELTVARR